MNPEVLAWAIAQPIGNRWHGLADAYTAGTTRVTIRPVAEVGASRRWAGLNEGDSPVTG